MADTNPADGVVEAVERVLALAATWLAWDGRPRLAEGGERAYTPHKAIRRTADHLVDPLAQVEALLAGVPTEEDRWLASAVTTEADRAPFGEVDLTDRPRSTPTVRAWGTTGVDLGREAGQRLRRLARTLALRYAAAGPEAWDARRGDQWTLRQIADHLADPWYAEQVGDLS
jgi:hypothetical protein